MDTLTSAMRQMTSPFNWVRLLLAGAAFFLAFQVAHYQAPQAQQPRMHSPVPY